MKIQLDTIDKTIEVEEAVSLSELVKTLEGLLPKGAWKEYKLKQKVVTITTPTKIDNYPLGRYPATGVPYWGTEIDSGGTCTFTR